jgi:two-component system, NarL family, nitrate/nitrite response regulator NarL
VGSVSVIAAIVTHPCTLFRDGLSEILAGTQFRLVHMAADLDEASIRHLPSAKTCVWLIGVGKCTATTYDFVRRVHSTTLGVKIVILAQSPTAEDVLAALEAGASGFLSQDISRERLVKSLELIALGEIVVPSEFLQAVCSRMTKPTPAQPSSRDEDHKPTLHVVKALSRRETSILRLLMGGASNKVIARRLVITEATVKVHIKAILRKLRLHNRTQAAMWAYSHIDGGETHNGAEAASRSRAPATKNPATEPAPPRSNPRRRGE